MPFLRQGSEAFRKELNPVSKDCQLFSLCLEYFSFSSNDISNIKLLKSFKIKSLQHILSHIHLYLALFILDMEKSTLSKISEGHNPSCNGLGDSVLFQLIAAYGAETLSYTRCVNIDCPVLWVCLYADAPEIFFFIFSDCYQLINRFHVFSCDFRSQTSR